MINLATTHPSIQIPAAAASFLAGGAFGGIFFVALRNITENILIKKCGDYHHPKKLNKKVVITINNQYFYYAIPTLVAGIAALISIIVYPILIRNDCSILIATTAAIGSIATPMISALFNCYTHYLGRCQRHYVILNDEEAKHLGIDLKNLEEIKQHGKLYVKFGKRPVCTKHYKG